MVLDTLLSVLLSVWGVPFETKILQQSMFLKVNYTIERVSLVVVSWEHVFRGLA